MALLALPRSAFAQQAGGPQSPPVTAAGLLNNAEVAIGLGGPGASRQPTSGGSTANSGATEVIPVSTSSGSDAGGSSDPPPISWSRHYYGDTSDPGYGVNSPIVCADGTRPYEDVGIDRASGEVVARQTGCESPAAPRQPGNGGAVAAPPPPPPTPAEIWAHVPLPKPVLGLNPSINGLTGLATWLWDPNGTAPVNAGVTLRGYNATATASPIHWEWRMWQSGDTPNVNPDPIVVANRPGTEAQPAATYMYETHGDFTVTLTVRWAGTYTYSGNGAAPTTTNLGTDTSTTSRTYHVISIRAARIG